jgi:hypothetical protein
MNRNRSVPDINKQNGTKPLRFASNPPSPTSPLSPTNLTCFRDPPRFYGDTRSQSYGNSNSNSNSNLNSNFGTELKSQRRHQITRRISQGNISSSSLRNREEHLDMMGAQIKSIPLLDLLNNNSNNNIFPSFDLQMNQRGHEFEEELDAENSQHLTSKNIFSKSSEPINFEDENIPKLCADLPLPNAGIVHLVTYLFLFLVKESDVVKQTQYCHLINKYQNNIKSLNDNFSMDGNLDYSNKDIISSMHRLCQLLNHLSLFENSKIWDLYPKPKDRHIFYAAPNQKTKIDIVVSKSSVMGIIYELFTRVSNMYEILKNGEGSQVDLSASLHFKNIMKILCNFSHDYNKSHGKKIREIKKKIQAPYNEIVLQLDWYSVDSELSENTNSQYFNFQTVTFD